MAVKPGYLCPPGYKQTEVGVIPEDWEVTPVGEAFDIHNNLRLPISQKMREKLSGPFPYYGPTNVQGFINQYRVEGEHALIGEDGDHFLKWRDQSMTLLVNGQFNVNNHAHLVKGTKNLTSWFYYYFSNRDLTPHLTRQGAGRYKLTKSTLLGIPCALPPTKAEQEAIAEALSDADALIESLEQLIAKKRHLKQGAMQALLTGKKRLPGFSGEWEVKRLGESCEIVTKGTTPTSIGRDFTLAGIIFLKAECIGENGKPIPGKVAFIDEVTHQLLKRSQLMEGDVVISIAGVLGRVGLIEKDILPANTNQALAIVRLGNESKFDRDYLFYYLRSPMIEKQISHINVQAAQANISLQNVKDFQISAPSSLSEQTAIAAILSDMDAEIAALETKLAKARRLKLGMIQELLTGRIRLI